MDGAGSGGPLWTDLLVLGSGGQWDRRPLSRIGWIGTNRSQTS